MSLNLRKFLDTYNPPREIFSDVIPKEQLNTYIYNGAYMSLTRAIRVSELSLIWLIKNDKDPRDKIDIGSLIHPKNKDVLQRLSNV